MKHNYENTTLPTVKGVGINDAEYSVVLNKCPYYRVWQSMITRCYSPQSLKNFPNYMGCKVTQDWLMFTCFKAWMLKQDWEGKVLDKDLLCPGNTIYGPKTCLFISQTLNTLLNTQNNQGGKYPKGVTLYGKDGKYRAQMRKNKKLTHLGVFTTVEAAAESYRNAKADWVLEHINPNLCLSTKTALIAAANVIRSTSP